MSPARRAINITNPRGDDEPERPPWLATQILSPRLFPALCHRRLLLIGLPPMQRLNNPLGYLVFRKGRKPGGVRGCVWYTKWWLPIVFRTLGRFSFLRLPWFLRRTPAMELAVPL